MSTVDAVSIEPLNLWTAGAYADLTYPACATLFGELGAGEASRLIGVTATCDGEPAGLALAWRSQPEAAILMSVVVKTDYRRRGISGRLVDAIERTLAAAGCPRVVTSFERGRPMRDVVERLLAGRGYSTPEVRALMCRVYDGGALLRQAPWWERELMPASFTIFPWRDLTQADRAYIADRQAREQWIPLNLNPFFDEQILEPLNSVGLRDSAGTVVGWSITHRPLPDLVRYTYLFVRQDLQRFGLAVPLLLESMRRHLFSPDVHLIPNATFKIPLNYEGMVKFARTRMAPYLNELNEIVDTYKDLA